MRYNKNLGKLTYLEVLVGKPIISISIRIIIESFYVYVLRRQKSPPKHNI